MQVQEYGKTARTSRARVYSCVVLGLFQHHAVAGTFQVNSAVDTVHNATGLAFFALNAVSRAGRIACGGVEQPVGLVIWWALPKSSKRLDMKLAIAFGALAWALMALGTAKVVLSRGAHCASRI